MNSRFVKILVAWLCLSGTLISFQNCSGGFSVEDQVGSIDSASSVLAAPDVVFMAASDTVNTSSVTVQFQVMGSASSVMCSLNGAAATDCSSQSVTYNNLADGDYTVDVTASSGSGANTRRRTLRKDSTAPVINVSMMPPASTSMTTASFVFTASDNLSGVMSVQCSLDNAAFAACASPVNLSALSQAAHNFRIQARDNAGNMSAIYSYNWTVAAAGTPSVTLSSAPSSVINSSSASFIFSGLNSVSFECSVDSGAFVACTSPHVLSSVAAGNHNFRVQGVSSSGVRSSPAQANWIVDVTAPSAPNVVGNVPATTNMTSASFTFSSTDTNGVARFECSQDSGAYSTCTSPRALSGLSAGNRSFAVRAVDNAGNTSAVTTFSWVIDVTPPTLAFTQTPAASTTATTAIFAFNSSEQAQCSLDNAAFANCTSPVNVSGLSVAAHSFRVQARDAAGNSTLISHSWTVTSTTPPPPPPPPTGPSLYFSDCQAGAAPGCVPGNNANPGTMASPKRDLAGININSLAAGTSLLFARGGAWANFSVRLANYNVTSAAPLTFADYGTGALPLFRCGTGTALAFGSYGDGQMDGGYTFRNLRLDGLGTGQWGAWIQGGTRDVVFENVELGNFEIGIHMQQMNGPGAPNDRVVVRNSYLHHNIDHGMLGDSNGLLIEGTLIEGNNIDGGFFEHGIYLGGHSTSTRIINNVFRNNSLANGVCTGGNLTIHGEYESLLIEGNTVEVTNSGAGCAGFSITAAYGAGYNEHFLNLIIRNNTIINGNSSMMISAAPGAIIENNRLFHILSGQSGISIPGIAPGPEDAVDANQIIRNNVLCRTAVSTASYITAPASTTLSNNLIRTGADATTGPCAR